MGMLAIPFLAYCCMLHIPSDHVYAKSSCALCHGLPCLSLYISAGKMQPPHSMSAVADTCRLRLHLKHPGPPPPLSPPPPPPRPPSHLQHWLTILLATHHQAYPKAIDHLHIVIHIECVIVHVNMLDSLTAVHCSDISACTHVYAPCQMLQRTSMTSSILVCRLLKC